MDESLDGLTNQLTAWKDSFYAKELWVNMSKTKILVSNPLANPNKYACGVCKMGAGNNLILYHHCKSWMHHRCSNIKGHLRPDPNFKCHKCCQEREITPAPQLKHINIDNNKLEVVRSFCYLADVTSKSAGYYNATTSKTRPLNVKVYQGSQRQIIWWWDGYDLLRYQNGTLRMS